MRDFTYRCIVVVASVMAMALNFLIWINHLDIAQYHITENIYDGGLGAQNNISALLLVAWIINCAIIVCVIKFCRVTHWLKAIYALCIGAILNLIIFGFHHIATRNIPAEKSYTIDDWHIIAQSELITHINLLIAIAVVILISKAFTRIR